MSDYETRWKHDRGFRRGDDRERWRSEGGDWRGNEFERHGREDEGERGYGRDYGRHGQDYGYEGPGRHGGERHGGWPDRGYAGQSMGREAGYGYTGGFRGGYGQDLGSRGGYRGYGPAESRGRDDERGWWDRTTDEISSWFGDEEAERRRRMDEMRAGEHRGRGPRGYSRSDDRIREDASDRLTDDPYVDASEIDITVSGGEVTLSGTVDSRMAKRRAEDIAESVSGVRHVQNNLRIRQPSYAGAGTAAGASAIAGLGTGTGGTTGSPGTPGSPASTGISRTTTTGK